MLSNINFIFDPIRLKKNIVEECVSLFKLEGKKKILGLDIEKNENAKFDKLRSFYEKTKDFITNNLKSNEHEDWNEVLLQIC